MAPRGRRRIPDLCGIALLQMMPPADQLRAGQMNRRWTGLLREANRRVCSLTIFCKNKETRYNCMRIYGDINYRSLGGSSRSMQMLNNEDGKPLYPITGSLSKWNCLEVQFPSKKNVKSVNEANVFSVVQIANAFSAITKLTFATDYPFDFKHLIEMFEQYPQWSRQLIALTLIDYYTRPFGTSCLSPSLNDRLFAAINTAMPALQRLTIKWTDGLRMVDDLPVIAQLKVLSADCSANNIDVLLPSLERYAADALDLQVTLNSLDYGKFNKLSEHVRDRFVRYSDYCISYPVDYLYNICNSFRSLVSFMLESTGLSLGEHFASLARLSQLVHLDLIVDLRYDDHPRIYEHARRPAAVLSSVRALDLSLSITDHRQVSWLSLGRTLLSLEAIHLSGFSCSICDISFGLFGQFDERKLDSTLKCLRIVLPQLHSGRGLPLSRILLNLPNYRTAEDVMNEANE